MIEPFTYHSEHHHSPTSRWRHFLLYVGALLLLVAAGRALWLYFTHWTDGEDHTHWWQLALGLLYLLIGAGLALLAYRQGRQPAGPADRYARIENNVLVYKLDQISGEQTVDLGEVRSGIRRNVRELDLEMSDGSHHLIPIYLVCNDEKQRELEKILLAL